MSQASKTILIAYIPLFVIMAAALGGVQFPAWLPYPWLKTLHVLGAVLFLGNMLTAPVWLSIAVQDREKKMMDYAFRLLRLTDLAFTLPGIFLLVITGVSMLQNWGGMYGQAWVWQSVVLIFAMWALSFPVLFCQEKERLGCRVKPGQARISAQPKGAVLALVNAAYGVAGQSAVSGHKLLVFPGARVEPD
jgi:uncharacterized membrane protein